MDRIIFHIDVNSAYLSWEAAYDMSHGISLDYRTIPSIVGGDPETRHGIVLAKSIPAKKYGVQTGESIYSALNKYPDLLIIPPHYDRYVRASDATVALISEYSEKIQRYSIDEVFVDMGYFEKDYMEVAKIISSRIERELGFTVNIGMGNNKLMAKMASDFEKPNKIHSLFQNEIKEKLWPLDVGDLFMVGRRTKAKLNSRGIKTIGDLANVDRDYMRKWLKKPGLQILDFANGIENSEVKVLEPDRKSVGNSTTTAFDVDNYLEAERFILGISEMVGFRLRSENLCGQVIRVSVKDSQFIRHSKQKKIYTPTDSTNKIFHTAMELFNKIWNGESLRQFSISVSELYSNSAIQLSFFESYNKKEKSINNKVDEIRDRYGNSSIKRCTFLHSGIAPVIGGVEEDLDYPMMKSEL